jgi:hypothetical protein
MVYVAFVIDACSRRILGWQGRPVDEDRAGPRCPGTGCRAGPALSWSSRDAARAGGRFPGRRGGIWRGCLEIARGRPEVARAALRGVGRLPGGPLIAAHPLTTQVRAFLLHVLVRRGETAQADTVLTETGEEERERPGIRIAVATLQLAQHNRERRPPRSRRSSTARPRDPIRCG